MRDRNVPETLNEALPSPSNETRCSLTVSGCMTAFGGAPAWAESSAMSMFPQPDWKKQANPGSPRQDIFDRLGQYEKWLAEVAAARALIRSG